MTRIVVKGENYTEVRFIRKNSLTETVMVWRLKKERKPEDCGIWRDGKKIHGFEAFDKQITIER